MQAATDFQVSVEGKHERARSGREAETDPRGHYLGRSLPDVLRRQVKMKATTIVVTSASNDLPLSSTRQFSTARF